MDQWCYIKDEGWPLGIGWQKPVPNRCVRLVLNVLVVSDTLKVSKLNWQVTVEETTEKEPSKRCRNLKDDVRTGFQALISLRGVLLTAQAASGIEMA